MGIVPGGGSVLMYLTAEKFREKVQKELPCQGLRVG